MPRDRRWSGADAGNEWALEEPAFTAILQIIRQHEPAPHTDLTSDFVAAVNASFPEKNPVQRRDDGSVSSIFRRGDPWRRLGLVGDDGNRLITTRLGRDFLDGVISKREAILPALFRADRNGENPYSVLANALLESPNRRLTLDEFVSHVTPYYVPGEVSLVEALAAPALTLYPRVRRDIRGILKVLVMTGAVEKDDQGFIAIDREFLESLAVAENSTLVTPVPTTFVEEEVEAGPARRRVNARDAVRRFSDNNRGISGTAIVQAIRITDPQERLEKLARATRKHEAVVVALGRLVEQSGGEAFEDPDSFDLFGRFPHGDSWLFEVKTITGANAEKQVRSALAQLLHYRHYFMNVAATNPGITKHTQLAIVVDREPRGCLPRWWVDLLLTLGIKLFWLDGNQVRDFSGETVRVDRAFADRVR